MATLVGKVGIVMKGAWSSSATYEVLDAVSYNNGLYIAKQAVPANTVPTNTTYWQTAVREEIVTGVETAVDILPYNSSSNPYTTQSDGYLVLLSEEVTSGSIRALAISPINTTAAVQVYMPIASANQRQSVFIKKGLRLYTSSAPTGVKVEFRPINY